MECQYCFLILMLLYILPQKIRMPKMTYLKDLKSLVFIALILSFGCTKSNNEFKVPDNMKYHDFRSYHDFKTTINYLANITDEVIRNKSLSPFWDSLWVNHQIPFVFGDSVAFLYSGDASSVLWAGDFNGWNGGSSYQGTKVGLTKLWMLEKTFPSDARLDYKIVVDGNWILDPANSYQQMSGFGNNSELRMPLWNYPQETILVPGTTRGSLSENILIHSDNLSYDVNYKVYIPYGYSNLSNLPVLYVTDGHEYANDQMGSLVIVLDNLIHSNKINPIIAVFIDPRDPSNISNNRRMTELTGNIHFADFVADELVPFIDSHYKTNSAATSRAIIGTSLGGWNSAYFGMNHSEKFQLIAIHSPAFDSNIIQAYKDSPKLPLKIFMSTGVIYDTQDKARAMKTALEEKGYPLLYKEVNEGHSWGNWRALMDEPLVYFFGKAKK